MSPKQHFLAGRRTIFALAVALLWIWSVSAQSPLQVGYSVYSADSGSRIPVGSALFRVSDGAGVVVSEAGVGAAEPIRTGRIFVDEMGTRMGLALVNAGSGAASITFTLRNSAGAVIGQRNYSLPAGQHLASYVSEVFPAEAAGVRGSLTFESNQPLAAVTLRENRNAQGEPLYTTLPVVQLAAASPAGSVLDRGNSRC